MTLLAPERTQEGADMDNWKRNLDSPENIISWHIKVHQSADKLILSESPRYPGKAIYNIT